MLLRSRAPAYDAAGLLLGCCGAQGITQQSHFLNDCDGAGGYTAIMNQGIVGMAYQPLLAQGLQLPLFDSVVKTTGIPDLFSMQCCGWSGKDAAGTGTLILGGIDGALHTGELMYTPITLPLYYCVHMTLPDARADPHAFSEIADCDSIIDSGTSAIALTGGVYQQALAQLNQQRDPGTTSQLPPPPWECVEAEAAAGYPCLHLELANGVGLDIPSTKYFQPVPGSPCLEFLITQTNGSPNIIGQVMMEAYYTVFDRANKRVGFAPIAGCGAEEPQTCP